MTGLALVVRSAPWAERSGRDALDLAMSALTMEVPLQLFFIGDGLLQLVSGRHPEDAGLPPGHKAWASLESLGEVIFYAHADDLDALAAAGLKLVVAVNTLAPGEMPSLQAGQQVLVV